MKKAKRCNTRGEAFDLYEQCTKDIDSPWPFPQYWVGDWAEFEVLHGGESGGTCDVRVGRVAQIFCDEHGQLSYRMKTEEGAMDISYAAFYGNWEPGEVLSKQLKCASCNGGGLTDEGQKSLKKVQMGGKMGYRR